MVKFKTKKDAELYNFWKGMYPKTEKSKFWEINQLVEDRGKPHNTYKVIGVRVGSSGSTYISQGVNMPIAHRNVGARRLSIAMVKTRDGSLHFANPKDIKRIVKR
jgi:hypothetical protein